MADSFNINEDSNMFYNLFKYNGSSKSLFAIIDGWMAITILLFFALWLVL